MLKETEKSLFYSVYINYENNPNVNIHDNVYVELQFIKMVKEVGLFFFNFYFKAMYYYRQKY